MSRTIFFCVLLLILGACDSGSSPSSSGASAASSSTTEHLVCIEKGGVETGQSPEPSLRVESQTVAAHYGFGTRESCPWSIEDDTAPTVAALDGGTLPGLDGGGDVDVAVATGTPMSVSISPWSDEIIVDYFNWSELGEPGAGSEVEPTEIGPGLWRLELSPDPGDYVLSLRYHWDYGEDSWGWHIRVLG